MNSFKVLLSFAGGCSLLSLLTGCASVMCGSRQDVAIDSKPRGAQVLVYDSRCEAIFTNVTPCVATLNRDAGDGGKGRYIVLVRKEGFTPMQIPLVPSVNGAYYLNFFTLGIGYLIDPFTGSMWTLNPEAIDGKTVKDSSGFFDHEHDGMFVALKPEVAEQPPGNAPPADARGIAQNSSR